MVARQCMASLLSGSSARLLRLFRLNCSISCTVPAHSSSTALGLQTYCVSGNVHRLCRSAHSASSKLEPWQTSPSGTVATRRPPIVLLKLLHVFGDGHSSSPGKRLHRGSHDELPAAVATRGRPQARTARASDEDLIKGNFAAILQWRGGEGVQVPGLGWKSGRLSGLHCGIYKGKAGAHAREGTRRKRRSSKPEINLNITRLG